MHLDTCIFAILDELRIYILTTIVISEDLEFPPRLVFNQGSKDFEEVKNFRLMLQEVNPTIPGKFIYEVQCIFGLNHGHMREWTSNVTVDQLKRCRGSLMTSSLILVLQVFSQDTTLTNSLRKLDLWLPYDHIFVTQTRNILLVNMAKYFMPNISFFISTSKKRRGV